MQLNTLICSNLCENQFLIHTFQCSEILGTESDCITPLKNVLKVSNMSKKAPNQLPHSLLNLR